MGKLAGIRANDWGQIVSTWGENWQPGDLCGQEVSADHLCGRVCMQTDDREGGRDTQEDETHLSLSDGAETHRGAENKGVRLKVTGCVRAQ